MRVLNLCHGQGNGVDSACLMTASNMLIGKGEDGDRNSCVCPILREFIIKTNDRMPLEFLGGLYGPLVWEIVGTRNDDMEVMEARAFKLVDWCVRVQVPALLDRLGDDRHEAMRAIGEISDRAAASKARDSIRGLFKFDSSASGSAAVYAIDSTIVVASGSPAAAAKYAAYAAAFGADYCPAVRTSRDYWAMFPEIIRKVASIGDTRPKEMPEVVLTDEQLVEALGGK